MYVTFLNLKAMPMFENKEKEECRSSNLSESDSLSTNSSVVFLFVFL